MKKKLLLFFLCLIMAPGFISAKEIYVEDLDLSITINNTMDAFTRDNIFDNPLLDDYDIDEYELYDIFLAEYIFLEAYHYNENNVYDYSVIVRAIDSEINNLKNFDRDYVEEFAQNTIDDTSAKTYKIFEAKNLVFVEANYQDSGYYLNEYYTVVNGEAVTLTIQSTKPFTSSFKKEAKAIFDSMNIKINPDLEDESYEGFENIFLGIGFIAVILLSNVFIGLFFMFIYTIIIIVRKSKRKKRVN